MYVRLLSRAYDVISLYQRVFFIYLFIDSSRARTEREISDRICCGGSILRKTTEWLIGTSGVDQQTVCWWLVELETEADLRARPPRETVDKSTGAGASYPWMIYPSYFRPYRTGRVYRGGHFFSAAPRATRRNLNDICGQTLAVFFRLLQPRPFPRFFYLVVVAHSAWPLSWTRRSAGTRADITRVYVLLPQ